jgi:hypothetical protein
MGELAAMLEEGVLEKAARGVWGSSRKEGRYSKHIERLKKGLSFEEFQELLRDMDTLMRSLPPTAQASPAVREARGEEARAREPLRKQAAAGLLCERAGRLTRQPAWLTGAWGVERPLSAEGGLN